ncbi:hypothetical protein P154DRAFT_611587 [Amniculicola lignicola CBS 123094]|uniref:BTB domain-containing protein n=1 Tax=Amniculicola lignicola CBS 123094 TaxID=1392246 RepID=A0A6A5WVW6_9PLEO|nr:hypothetical protein P154DRAFT_611587 [Amniculicola lignicola CBS 123094]
MAGPAERHASSVSDFTSTDSTSTPGGRPSPSPAAPAPSSSAGSSATKGVTTTAEGSTPTAVSTNITSTWRTATRSLSVGSLRLKDSMLAMGFTQATSTPGTTASSADTGSSQPSRRDSAAVTASNKATSAPRKPLNPNNLPVIELHEHGDITLIIGPKEQPVLVSISVLRRASPVWRKMFGEPWIESREKEARFPEDNLDALLIVLRIAHLRFRDIPQKHGLEFRGLVQLAVVCDKYDTVEIVCPFFIANKWYAPWRQRSKDHGFEEWLMITWTFGNMPFFEEMAKCLHLTVHKNTEGKYLRDGCTKPLGSNMPPGFLDELVAAREQAIKEILAGCDRILKKTEKSHECVCKAKDNKEAPPPFQGGCQAMLFGALYLGFSRLRISAITPEYSGSFSDLVESIKNIPVYPYISKDWNGKRSYKHIAYLKEHVECTKEANLTVMIDGILASLPPPVLEHHKNHIAIQEKKWLV